MSSFFIIFTLCLSKSYTMTEGNIIDIASIVTWRICQCCCCWWCSLISWCCLWKYSYSCKIWTCSWSCRCWSWHRVWHSYVWWATPITVYPYTFSTIAPVGITSSTPAVAEASVTSTMCVSCHCCHRYNKKYCQQNSKYLFHFTIWLFQHLFHSFLFCSN